MKTYFIISLIFYFLYIIFKSKKYFHMLQQNWYNDGNRYLKWIVSNFVKTFVTVELLSVLFLIKTKYIIYTFIGFYILLYYIFDKRVKKEQSKKPFALTSRVKRLYTTMLIIYLINITFILLNFKDQNINYYYLYLSLLVYINPIIIYISNIINKPIEKLVFLHYKRLAMNKLYNMNNLKRIGITGSYGKTSTKNALNDILSVKFNSFATEKSFNTMNGLMISINNKLDKFSDTFIAEMGAFKQGEIKQKSDFIKPQYGILTKVGNAHLESFGSIKNTCKAKFELIESLPEDGIAILNMDDEYQKNYDIKSKCKKVWVSIKDKKADLYANNIKLSNKGTSFTCIFKDTGDKIDVETKLLGSANVYNILEAIALSYNLGLTPEEIKRGVKRISPVEHRLELKKYGNVNIIDDAYNSNPVGSQMALDVLDMMEGKKIIVTPGMIELGDKQYEYNMEFGRNIAKVCDEVILIGKEQTKPIYDGLMKQKYNKDHIYILNDVKLAFPLLTKLSDKSTYALLENDLPDIFNE